MDYNQVLFGVDKKGGFKAWIIEVHGNEMHVIHGKLGGKLQRKIYKAKPKNVGRSNETTEEQQALLEAQARVRKQLDKGYRPTQNEALETSQEQLLPMLASDYTKCKKKEQMYPSYTSPKLDGVRSIASIKDSEVNLMSRGGKSYPVAPHLDEQINQLFEACESSGEGLKFDGELYIHGQFLQEIVSCVKKSNVMTVDLEYWIFDIPSDKPFSERNEDLKNLEELVERLGLTHIKVVVSKVATTEGHAYRLLQEYIGEGYEGLMLRKENSMYEWNHRSKDLMKWKEFQEAEFKVIGVEEDILGEGVFLMQLGEGYFKAKPRGCHAVRSINNSNVYLDKWVTVRFQQYSMLGVPIFPVIIAIRECDEDGNPIE